MAAGWDDRQSWWAAPLGYDVVSIFYVAQGF
jgi:hypothetical protein